ncbi:hypothetical protein JNUCC0626_24580 [Lentzea sp. JNUCC 0626]|uniref:hypothetical protein n=1 Tax=Lentzea sp. JNUCC 0626 TaxID=3367513 RepID=UPI003748BE69
MGTLIIVCLLGVVALVTIVWVGHHVRLEQQRRRQVARVRVDLAGSVSVTELRQRCGADSLPLLPTPRTAVGDPDPAAERGSISERAA